MRRVDHLEPVDVRPSTAHAALLALCARCDSPLGEVAEAVGVPLLVLRAVAAGRLTLVATSEHRVGAWLQVVWLRHARARGVRVSDGEWSEAVSQARAAGVTACL